MDDHLCLTLPDIDATARLAGRLAGAARPGDILLLEGPIGAGKSTFARAFIRARLDRPTEEVPSPTFTLVQTYEHPIGDLWHCDLYRLTSPDEAWELGLDAAFETAICLVEWPDRLGADRPVDASTLAFVAGDEAHTVKLSLSLRWADRGFSLHE